MSWEQLIAAMQRRAWSVWDEGGCVDVETEDGGQCLFERTARGLKQARAFYYRYVQRDLPVSERTRPSAYRPLAETAQHLAFKCRVISSLVVVGCYLAALADMACCALHPSMCVVCVVVVVCILPVYVWHVRRLDTARKERSR